MNGGSGGLHAVAGSGGEAVGSMVDANDERWEKPVRTDILSHFWEATKIFF